MVEAGGMPADEVHRAVDALAEAGCASWLEGGWGVDALVGRQTRQHRDLDLAFDAQCEEIAVDVLGALGYALENDWRPVRFELVAPPSRHVDMHPVVLDQDGNGVQAGPGGTTFFYPSALFTSGVVAGRVASCISADLQIRFHSGYDLHEVDRADLDHLHQVAARDRGC